MTEITDPKAILPSSGGGMVNHPSHYNQGGIECIEGMEASKGWFKTAIFCECNDFKYNWRVGEKDLIPQELGKMAWYINKAKDLWNKALCWFYPKNQHYYAIVRTVRMKSPESGNWVDAVLYTDGKGFYVREVDDFHNKFQLKVK
jgi:hypothetical protein